MVFFFLSFSCESLSSTRIFVITPLIEISQKVCLHAECRRSLSYSIKSLRMIDPVRAPEK